MQSAPKRVLIVDDSEEIRWVLKTYLQLEGFLVLTAANGREALDVLSRETPIHFIILDLVMPIMNGSEFLEHRSRTEAWANIPLVICSGELFIPNEKGVIAQLRKPFDTRQLIELLHKHCG